MRTLKGVIVSAVIKLTGLFIPITLFRYEIFISDAAVSPRAFGSRLAVARVLEEDAHAFTWQPLPGWSVSA